MELTSTIKRFSKVESNCDIHPLTGKPEIGRITATKKAGPRGWRRIVFFRSDNGRHAEWRQPQDFTLRPQR